MASHGAPVTIGILFSTTGVTAVLERAQRQAAMLAVKQINSEGGLLGRELLLLDSDPASSPARSKTEAERLLDAGAEALFGCYMSSTRKAVLPVVEARNSLLFYPTLYEGFEYAPCCIYSGAAPNQNAGMLADYLTETHGDSYFFVGSNYVYPYESNRIMRDLLSNRGAKVVDEVYISLNPSDEEIAKVIATLKNAGPVVVFSTLVGDGAVRFYRAYDRAGFDRHAQPIASLTFGEPEIHALGNDAATGHIKAAPYFSVVDTAANKAFIHAYQDSFGPDSPVSAEAEAAYFQVRLFAEAVRRAGTTDRMSVVKALPTFSFEAPQGTVRVDAVTHHTHLWPRVAVVGEGGKFQIVREATEPVAPDPYLVELEKRPRDDASDAVYGRS
ncbi:MAG: transporter substrate-binding domain-containing protein [Roseinatronobacter sp.]|nr:transporter substrate-binding domain-containing protein [Roseinatronobacter sp.]